MSLNDPFFDAWVRDKLQHAEARPPDHLWDAIRKGSHYYIVADRNRYFLIVLLLFLVTGGIAYWAFHPITPPTPASAALSRSDRTIPSAAALADVHTPASAQGASSTRGAVSTDDASTNDASSTRGDASTHNALIAHDAANTSDDVRVHAATGTDATSAIASAPENPLASAGPLTPAGLLAPAAKDADLAVPFRITGAPASAEMTVAAVMTDATTVSATANPDAATTAAPTILLRPRRHTYLEVYAGPDHNTHYITASNPVYKPYVQEVKGMEMGYPSFSLGLRLDMPLWTDNWRLRLGVHYAQINEQLHYFNPSVVKTVSQVTMRSVVQPSGAVVQVADTTSVSYKGQYVKQSLNAYRQIDLPVLASYTFLHARQFQMAGTAGAFFNISSWYNGDILDTTYLPSALHGGSGNAASTWKNHLAASLYGSLSLRNQLTSHIQVSLEPYLRYELGTVNKDVQVYKERFVTSGIAIGLEFALGR